MLAVEYSVTLFGASSVVVPVLYYCGVHRVLTDGSLCHPGSTDVDNQADGEPGWGSVWWQATRLHLEHPEIWTGKISMFWLMHVAIILDR